MKIVSIEKNSAKRSRSRRTWRHTGEQTAVVAALEALRTLVIVGSVAFRSSISPAPDGHVPGDGGARARPGRRLADETAAAGTALAPSPALAVPETEVSPRSSAPQPLERGVWTAARLGRGDICRQQVAAMVYGRSSRS